MTVLRITSVGDPLAESDLLPEAIGLVRRAVGIGLLSGHPAIERLDMDLVRSIAREASEEGVGRDSAIRLLEPDLDDTKIGPLIAALEQALADSPVPDREIRELLRTYDYEGLANLTGTSVASLRRYAAGSRKIPDELAARVHHLALVTSDLAGSYNDFGIRRWWDRPRAPLEGRSPRAALGSDWDPDGAAATAIARLAASLVGNGGAS